MHSIYRARRGAVLLAIVAAFVVGSCRDRDNPVDSKSDDDQAPRRLTSGPYLDILPNVCPNPVNPKSKDTLSVAVLGEETFDVTTIDVSSLLLNGTPPLASGIADVSKPPASMDTCACVAEGPDGFNDLVLLFSIQEVIEAISPVAVGSQRLLTLTGQMNIETPFEARDCLLISGEIVSVPDAPSGDGLTRTGRFLRLCTGGAETSLGHPVEFRLDLDADGVHRYSEWSGNPCPQVSWTEAGTYTVRAEARCALHNTFVSLPSQEGLQVKVNEGPETEIFGVLSTYFIDGQEFQEMIDITDEIPDTVPYGSWINVLFRGIRPPGDSTNCMDMVNECLTYQNNYTRRSTSPPIQATMRWLPDIPSDDNPFGTEDSTSMNVSSWEYTVRARSSDEFGFVDLTPSEVEIIGNFDPTLDTYNIENFDGFVAGDGDSIQWDWLSPSNLDPVFPTINDTVDFTVNPPQVVKQWYFVIEATGHDHPKEPTGSGVKAWLYRFTRADDPDFEQRFARSGVWVDGMAVDVLDDTFMFEVRYTLPLIDPMASINAWRNLPDWLNRGYDYHIQGRDTESTDVFSQYMWLDGMKVKLNEYNAAILGRRTAQRQLRFYIGMHP
jgi:hypothetical protein